MSIGHPLTLSPDFPPTHTVHETFTSHGVPSPPNGATTGYPSADFHQRHKYCASTLTDVNSGYEFPLNASSSSAFHVPIYLSVHPPLGRFCKPVSWDVPITHQGGSTVVNLLHLTDTSVDACRLVHSKLCQRRCLILTIGSL